MKTEIYTGVLLLLACTVVRSGTVTFTQPAFQTDSTTKEQYLIVGAETAKNTGVSYAATASTTNGQTVSNWKWVFTNATDANKTQSTTTAFTEKYKDSAYGLQNPTTLLLDHPNSNVSLPLCTSIASGKVVSTINIEAAAIGVVTTNTGSGPGTVGNPIYINDTNNNRNFVVGQQIHLSVVVPGGHQPTAYLWTTPPGTVFKNYVETTGVLTPLGSSDLTGQSITYYWADGADNRTVTCRVTINSVNYNITATVNVKRPTASITFASNATASVDANFGNTGSPGSLYLQAVHLGDLIYTAVTFSASVTPPTGFTTGHYEWIQVVNSISEKKVYGGTTYTRSSTNVLDDPSPYAGVQDAAVDDAPGTQLVANEDGGFLTDNFTMYLMWKCSLTNAEYVPLRKVSWGWTGYGTHTSSTTWSASGLSSPASTIADSDATSPPTWSGTFTTTTWSPSTPP